MDLEKEASNFHTQKRSEFAAKLQQLLEPASYYIKDHVQDGKMKDRALERLEDAWVVAITATHYHGMK